MYMRGFFILRERVTQVSPLLVPDNLPPRQAANPPIETGRCCQQQARV
jgi:hypothetical protein